MARGGAGGLMAQGKILDPVTGFSTTLRFPSPDTQHSNAMHAVGLPIGRPSKDSPFARMGTFIPHVAMRNMTGAAQTVTLTVEYPQGALAEKARKLKVRNGDNETEACREYDGEAGESTGQLSLPPLSLAAYSTDEVTLASALEALPLPLPYASLRIQFTGPTNGVIAEVASVDEGNDLVVDSRAVNESWSWAGSGANPFHLDDQAESVLFLTDMGEKSVRMVFYARAGDVNQVLTQLQLDPHETRAINLRKLRDTQRKDFRGRRIPANATDGTVTWARVDNEPVAGRVVMINRHRGVASNYDCCICPCPVYFTPSFADYAGLVVCSSAAQCPPWMQHTTISPGVGSSYQLYAGATWVDCNGNYAYTTDITSSYYGTYWSTSNGSVATVDQYGNVTAQGAGTAYISTENGSLCIDWEGGDFGWQWCSCMGYYPYSDYATVTPLAITGPRTVWFFDGETPANYATTITLTAVPSGLSSYTWSLLAGTDKGVLSGQSSNTIQLSGNDLSTSEGDITVQLEAGTSTGNVFTSQTYTVRGPYKLVHNFSTHAALPGFGYESQIYYTIYDNFNATMPSPVGFSEEWTTSPQNKYTGSDCNALQPPGTNWSLFVPTPQGDTTNNSTFHDLITGPGTGNTPAPCPTPISPQETPGPLVIQWGQRWRVGSTAAGAGAPVQADTFERFVDHGGHTDVTSPD